MWQVAVPWWQIVLRSLAIYIALLALLRIFGKREVGQFTLFDLVLVLLVANAVQPAMTGTDSSLSGGLIIIVTLVGANYLLSIARQRVPFVARLLEPQPTVIARDGRWIDEAIQREDVTLDEAEMALREHGIADVHDVEVAVLESDGSISVVPRNSGGSQQRRRRRVRVVRHL